MLRGELARRVRCSPETLRYYERIGLLDPPARSPAGYRLYGRHHLRQAQLIRAARELGGFEMDEIRNMLSHARAQEASCDPVDAITREHIRHIDAKIARLRQLRRTLKGMVDACHGDTIADCGIVSALSEQSLPSECN